PFGGKLIILGTSKRSLIDKDSALLCLQRLVQQSIKLILIHFGITHTIVNICGVLLLCARFIVHVSRSFLEAWLIEDVLGISTAKAERCTLITGGNLTLCALCTIWTDRTTSSA